ncbi:hypothetical protein FXW78_22380 [Rhodococcus opacus]|nr:hypothetical protein [Rhodococcus opacus]
MTPICRWIPLHSVATRPAFRSSEGEAGFLYPREPIRLRQTVQNHPGATGAAGITRDDGTGCRCRRAMARLGRLLPAQRVLVPVPGPQSAGEQCARHRGPVPAGHVVSADPRPVRVRPNTQAARPRRDRAHRSRHAGAGRSHPGPAWSLRAHRPERPEYRVRRRPGSVASAAHAGWLDSAHAKWLRKVGQEQDRSKEEFVKHFKRKYGGPLPVWVVTEILDFGGLSRLYEGLKQRDRDDIAASFDLKDNSGAGHGAALVSWMKNLNYIRNTCAHHSRLWNRNIDVQLSYRHLSAIADLQHAASPATTKRVYASLAVLAYLLNHVSPGSSWTTDVLGHIRSGLAAMNRSEAEMGCPPRWVNEILWA